MQRREALRLLASAATLPLVSRDAFSLFQEVHQQLPQTAALKALDAHQNATVVTISELIIPQTDTPGAKAARVNEFIDLIVAEWYDQEQKSTFLTGLADVDRRSQGPRGLRHLVPPLFGRGPAARPEARNLESCADPNGPGQWRAGTDPAASNCLHGSALS